MSSAFASILQARPCPTFGRPVHLWGSPLDYGPVLLLMPFGFHLTVDTLPSGVPQMAASGPPWPVSDFRLCARLGFSIPSAFSGQRRIIAAFGYSAPHLSCRRDLNPLDQCAAQRKIDAGRFHCDLRHLELFEPHAHSNQIISKRAVGLPHCLTIAVN